MLVLTVLMLCFISNVPAKPFFKATAKCGYESCPSADPTKLNVHLVPHSHDDVGWLKTVDEYYYGELYNIQNAGVQYIIDSVIHALSQNPERRFIQVETAFFDKWWHYQSDTKKEEVKKLVNNGQLEFVGGAWSMNDEATVHYQSTIDQFTLGLRILNDTLGECARPKVGWQIDPFGHSREMASIFARMGYDGLFFSRLDWRDKNNRLQTKNAEIVWKGSQSIEKNLTNLFTSALYNHYSAPSGFCFDVLCNYGDPIVDDKESPIYNLESKVKAFGDFVRKQAAFYSTNNIIITMGDDFHYQDALSYFANLDKLIDGFKTFQEEYEGKIINVFYSTPSCYLKAVHEASLRNDITFNVKTDDFLPYATDYHAYWSGFYTSRPTSKRGERQGNHLLQVAKQLTSLTGSDDGDVTLLKQAMGVMQHHDAITGTEKDHVWRDYHRLLHKAVTKSVEVAGNAILKILSVDADLDTHKLTTCLLANMTICPQSNNEDTFLVIVYNPLSRIVSHYVRIPVSSTSFDITDLTIGGSVEYQVAKPPGNFNYTGFEVSKYELVFSATNLPPLGFKVYKVDRRDGSDDLKPIEDDDKYSITNGLYTLQVDVNTGKLTELTLNNKKFAVSQDILYYEGAQGDNGAFERRASGAYIFRPQNDEAITISDSVTITTYKGKIFEEIHQQFNDWVTQVIRLYISDAAPYIEFDWIVGPIDTTDDIGKEIITRFTTELESGDTFYTDSNGREIIKRRRDFRSDYNFTVEEPVAGNYHPVTSRISLRDEEQGLQFSLLNDRAQGGTSLKSGQVELMLHRKCLNDDAFGVGESLQETEFEQGLVVRGQVYVTLNSITDDTNAAQVERELAQTKLLGAWVFINATSLDSIFDDMEGNVYSGLTKELPDNVQLLTLELLDETTVLLRLEHIYEVDEHPKHSEPVSINLAEDLFNDFTITSLKETALAGDRWIDEVERLHWKTEEDDLNKTNHGLFEEEEFVVKLNPMEIRTFVATIQRKSTEMR